MKNILIIFLFLFSVNLFAQDFSEDEKKILVMQDTRTLGENKELLNYVNSTDNKLIWRALFALASIQDSNSVDCIGNFLAGSSNSQLKNIACYALGQTPCNKSTGYLLKTFGADTDTLVVGSSLLAIGKIGDETSLGFLLGHIPESVYPKNALAFSIAKYAIRNIKSKNAVDFLCSYAAENPAGIDKTIIAYALARMRNKELLAPAHETLLNMAKSDNPKTRMYAYSALGYIADSGDMDFITDALNKEQVWTVKVNILNSLPLYKKANENILTKKLAEAISELFIDGNPNVAITALRTSALLYSGMSKETQGLSEIKYKLEWYFKPDIAVDWQIKGEALLAYGTIFKDEVKEQMFLKMSETSNEDLIPYIIKSFQFLEGKNIYRELTDSVRAVVQKHNKAHNQESGEMVQDATLAGIYRAYVESLAALKNKEDEKGQYYIMLVLSEFTGSKDPSILDICFTALNEKMYENKRDEIKLVLMMDYKELSYPKDKDAIISFINEFAELQMKEAESVLIENLNSPNYDVCKASANALKKITGKDYTFKTKPRTDFDWDFIKKLDKKRYATINTESGNIKIELLTYFAPFTVQNFVKLAEKNFYDNTVFHRIVPNFVIQGGDPLNNGYGGPEYSIRSEFTGMWFKEGGVGMASDGKDTEGSQFFIMHSHHPHLEGKYTLFGYVTEGQNVVDNVLPYEKIINITFSEN